VEGYSLSTVYVWWVVVSAHVLGSGSRASLEQRLACDDVAAVTGRSMDLENDALDLATLTVCCKTVGKWLLCRS
jgi:hypothetical protein